MNTIPTTWSMTKLKDIGSTYSGLSGKTKEDFGRGKSYVPYKAVFSDTFLRADCFEKVEVLPNESQNQVEQGDILLTTSSETPDEVGMASVLLEESGELYLNSFCFGFRPIPNRLDMRFSGYWLRSDDARKAITFLAQGSTRFNISKNKVLDIELLLPPLPEQKKIARILSSVDSKLALIDQQITTTQTLKKGLMQKLFTQGVGTQDADGRWQPHTEFQESELGRIPTDWAVTKLDELVTRGSGHTPDKQHPEYWNGGIKWISLADSSRLDQGTISTTDKEISHLGIDNSSAVLHPKGTVVMSRDAGIGKSAVMGEDMAVSQHFIAWNCEQKGKLNNWFLYYLLQLMKPEFERIAIGSTIKTIGLPYFKKLTIAHPVEIDEQQKIARILSTVDCKLDQLQTQKTQTQHLKKGLMQKLLTGQIRVQPDPQDN